MPEITAGAISLDLNIKDRLAEQIADAANAAQGPAARIGKQIEKAVETSMQGASGATAQALTKAAENAASAIVKKMNKLTAMIREKLGALDFPSESAKEFSSQIDGLNEKLSLMQKTWQELANSDPLSKASIRMDQLEKKVTALEKKLHGLTGKRSKPSTSVPSAPSTSTSSSSAGGGLGASDVTSALSGGAGGIAGLIGTAVSGNPAIGAAVGSVTSGVIGTVSKSFSKVSRLINKLTGNAAAKLKSLASNILDITKPLRKLGSMIKRAFKSIFIASAIYGAFRALKDGIIEAANADEKFVASLNEVKANLAIAFTPIIQYVLPYLDEVMAKLATTSKQIATFMAGLFGMTYQQAAEARKKLDETIKKAEKAKNAIAGIDELNILGSDDEEDSGIDYSKLDMSDAKLPDWAELLKQSIKDGDWSSVGQILAGKVNGILNDIPWGDINTKLRGKIKNLTKLINGFVKGIDPKVIGKTIAGVVNTVTGSINTFVDNINWSEIGSKIAQSLNSAIEQIDWRELGRMLTAGLRVAIDLLYSFSSNFNWSKFGVKLGEMFNSAISSIDTVKLAKGLSQTIRGIITTAISFLDVTDFEQIGTKLSDFFNNLDVHGIATDLTVLLMKIWSKATESLNTFLEKTDWFNLGSDLFEGIGDGAREAEKEGNGASTIIGSTVKLLKNIELAVYKFTTGAIIGLMKHISKCISDRDEEVVKAVSEMLGKLLGKFTKLREDIEKVWEKIGEWFGDRFSEARKNIESKFSSIGTWFGDRWADITVIFTGVGSWFRDRFKAARENIEQVFKDIGTWFGKRWDEIKEKFEGVGSWFKGRFNAAYENITEGDWLDLPDFFSDIWEGVRKKTVDGLNEVLEEVESFVNKTTSAMSALNVLGSSSLASKVIGKIHIPRLATGGLATAPTLAMIGDNRNAKADPEVVAPLSKLEGMMGGDNAEVVELLRLIVELLRSGISAELIGNMFGGDFKRTVLRIVAEDNARRG